MSQAVIRNAGILLAVFTHDAGITESPPVAVEEFAERWLTVQARHVKFTTECNYRSGRMFLWRLGFSYLIGNSLAAVRFPNLP